jgi:DHA2 family multidrug resistance protein
MFYMAGFNLQIDFWTAVTSRVIQSGGLALLFVPINASAFYYVPREKTGQGTGIINLLRNIGGSSGIAFVTTLLARQAQSNRNLLIHTLTPLNPIYRQAIAGVRTALIQRGVSPALADHQAQGLIGNVLTQQATVVAYVNIFRILGVIALILIIPMLFLKKSKGSAVPVEM